MLRKNNFISSMIPLKLSLEGLYSYQKKQEIDFTRLTEASLFGIFGATGSGKSSILEAITFALYGQSDRLNQRDNRGYNMMNLRSDRLFIDFLFESGGEEYRFTVNGRRNSKNYEDVRTIERKAFQQKEGELIPLPSADVEKIIGLSYDNFRRTIIIPQGKFQEFLQLGEADRTRMLKEIFHLQRFELDRKVKSLQGKNKLHLEQKNTLLTELSHATEEVLAELNEQLTAKETALKTRQQELNKLEKEFTRLENLRQLFEKISQQKQTVADLSSRQEEMEEKARKLKEYEYCLVELKPILVRQTEQQEALDHTTQELRTQREALVETENELASSEQIFAQIEEEYQQRDQLLQKAQEFTLIKKLKEQAKIVGSKEDRIKNGQQSVTDVQNKIQHTRQEIQTARQKMATIKANMPDFSDVMAVQEWFAQKKQVQSQLSQHQKQIQQEQKKRRELEERKRTLLRQTHIDARQYDLSIDRLLVLLQEERQQLQLQREEAEKQKSELLVQAQFKEISEQLEEGEPCPVCGSVHHPEKPDFDNVLHQERKLSAQIKDWQASLQQAQTVGAQLEGLALQLAAIQERILQQEQEQLHWEGEQTKLEAAFVWAQFNKDDNDSLKLHLDQFKQNQKSLEELDIEVRSLEKSLEDQENKLQVYQKAIEKLQKEREESAISFQSLKGQLKLLDFESHQYWDDLHLQTQSEKLRENYRSLEDGYRSQKVRLQRSRENGAKLKGRIQELDKQEAKLSARLGELNQQFNAKLSQSPFDSRTQVKAILQENFNVEAVKEEIRRFREQRHSALEKLSDLQAEAEGKSFDEERFAEIKDQITERKKTIEEQQIQLGSLRNDQEKLTKDLERKRLLQKEKDQLELRGEELRVLHNLFRASGFVNYVSTIYLQNLCRAANDRFLRLTRGSLRLDLARSSNSFEVIDQLNGGRRRSVKTLSGGQTFQASLCLALALADQVQQQAQADQNFFFLDEGFGSQDKDSLRIIFETLKSLARKNALWE
jgi:exonuclease SbcC